MLWIYSLSCVHIYTFFMCMHIPCMWYIQHSMIRYSKIVTKYYFLIWTRKIVGFSSTGKECIKIQKFSKIKWIIQQFSSNANFSFSFIPGYVNGTFTVSWTDLKGQSKNLVISYWKVNAITWHWIPWKTFPGDAFDNTVPFINLLHYLLWVWNMKLTY